MKIFNYFKRDSDLERLSQEEFDAAVFVLTQYATEWEVEEVLAGMVKRGISEEKAIELYLFIPTAFCRQFIPEADYKDFYVDYYGPHKQIERKYQDNKLYVSIEKATRTFFASNPSQEAVLNICSVAAEFKSINQALHNGSKIENLTFAPSYITR